MTNILSRLAVGSLMVTLFMGAIPAAAQEVGVVSEIVGSQSASPQEKIEFAANATSEMRDAVKSISKLLDSARRDSTAEQLQCLNFRLTAVRALVQVSEAAEIQVKEKLASGDTEVADHEFRKIAVALSKTRALLAEAERCQDQGGLESGQSVTERFGGITDDGDDTEGVPFEDMDLNEDPPNASPYQ